MQGGSPTDLRNNILWVEAGADISVADDSQVGLTSDYNDLYQGTDPNAHVGFWNGATSRHAGGLAVGRRARRPLARRQPGLRRYGRSRQRPGLHDRRRRLRRWAGRQLPLRRHSPAIDAADAWAAPPTDREGFRRADDPGVPNTGSPDYRGTVLGSSLFAATGTARTGPRTALPGRSASPAALRSVLRDELHERHRVHGRGRRVPARCSAATDRTRPQELLANRIICPLWDNLRTNGTGDNIFVNTATAGQVSIRWNATNEADGDVNFAVTLFADGGIPLRLRLWQHQSDADHWHLQRRWPVLSTLRLRRASDTHQRRLRHFGL